MIHAQVTIKQVQTRTVGQVHTRTVGQKTLKIVLLTSLMNFQVTIMHKLKAITLKGPENMTNIHVAINNYTMLRQP